MEVVRSGATQPSGDRVEASEASAVVGSASVEEEMFDPVLAKELWYPGGAYGGVDEVEESVDVFDFVHLGL